MLNYYRTLLKVDAEKFDVPKGIRQALLIFLSLFPFYLMGHLSWGLLVSLGTMSHIYVFSGTLSSKIKTVVVAGLTLAIAMMIGTLVSHNTLLFGIFILIFTIVPYYVTNALSIKGPSATFFLVVFGISSIMPEAPEQFLFRGAFVMLGGLLSILLVCIETLLIKKDVEREIVIADYTALNHLMKQFNDKTQFNELSERTLLTIMSGTQSINAAKPPFNRSDVEYHRMTLLHNIAQGLYAELLELNAKGQRPLPDVIVEMFEYIVKSLNGEIKEPWRKAITVDDCFQSLVNQLFKVEEVMHAPAAQINYKVRSRMPMFSQRLIYNLTPKSIVFMMTIKYAAIMMSAVLIALLFEVERPYWVALSVHTVLLGNTTVSSLQRSAGRVIGTLIGIAAVMLIIHFEPPMILILILIALFGGLNEILIMSNYALAMISITIQVLLISSLAVGHLSKEFAFLRIEDTVMGVVITLIGIFLLGRVNASSRLPNMLAELTRLEAVAFHYLFSKTVYTKKDNRHRPLTDIYLMLFNARETYNTATGELGSNRERTLYYYPALFMLEQMSFILTRTYEERVPTTIDRETMSKYLLAFEEVAKYFEYHIKTDIVELPLITDHKHIRDVLDDLQEIKLYDINEIKSIK